LKQAWLLEIVRRMVGRLPILMGIRMGLATLFRPKTSGWERSRVAMEEYMQEREQANRRALKLD